MSLVAVRDAAFGPLNAVLSRVPTLETVETQSLRMKTRHSLLDAGIDQDVTILSLVDATANAANACQLLLRRRGHKLLSVRRRLGRVSSGRRRSGNLRCRRWLCLDASIGQDRHPTRDFMDEVV